MLTCLDMIMIQIFKKIFLSLLSFCSIIICSQNFKNDSIKSIVDKSLDLIKANAVDTENILLIEKALYGKSKDLNSFSEAAPIYTEVFSLLKDFHGGLKYRGKTYGWNKPQASGNTYLKSRLGKEKLVVAKVLNHNTGYIRIPGNDDFSFKKVDSIANDIVDRLNSVNSKRIKSWIIDLRTNTGGNMYPILLGLKEFISDQDIIFGGFRNGKGESSGKWEIRGGQMLIDGIELKRQRHLTLPLKKDVPVIILTSCYTASAGEMTAISLIGRKNTVVVGEPSADYTTAVQGFRINQDTGINLSTDYVVDRNSKIYTSKITPDFQIIGGDNLEQLEEDKKILQALKLLKQ